MLLIGYGNVGRGDDGLGPAFAERIEAAGLSGISVDLDYQLTVDHAPMVAEHDLVVFADALMGADAPFTFTPLEAGKAQGMGSHSLTPVAVLTLAATLFGKAPRAYVLGISGHDFGEVKEGLSEEALANLALAEEFFRGWWARESAGGAMPQPV